jgi:hypothetical protein
VTQEEVSAPVFVDATGRRRRQVRRVAYAVGAVCMTYTGLVGASVIGDPVRPGAFGPLAQPGERPAPLVRQTPTPHRPPTVDLPWRGGHIDPAPETVPLRRMVAAARPGTTEPGPPPESPDVESTPAPVRPTESATPTAPPVTPQPTGSAKPTVQPTPTGSPEPPESPEPIDPVEPAGPLLPIVDGILHLLGAGEG